MLLLDGLSFKWVSGRTITDALLGECSDFYSRHYGEYGEGAEAVGRKPGDRIKMSASRMRQLLNVEGALAGLAYHKGQLVAYAFLVQGQAGNGGVISWVTQLVVHEGYRDRRVASRLLHAAWGLTDQFAWGLATANPYAVRALEASTRRRCEPRVIGEHVEVLREFTGNRINYFSGIDFNVTSERCRVNTKFFVSHSTLEEKMKRVCGNGKTWTLGNLIPGWEWLAVTVRSQQPRELTLEELDRLLADQDGIVKEAYARMLLDQDHKWMESTVAEVEFIVGNLGLRRGAKILDAGCGIGRHAIELAKRGFHVVGVDFVSTLLDRARANAASAGCETVEFILDDCRTFDLRRQFDAAICLYDVVGSFPKDEDNDMLLRGVVRHLAQGAPLLLSVMNRALVEAEAVNRGPIRDRLKALLELPPSTTMQESGEIFNPKFYLFDPETGVVYRKEQFKLDDEIPCELIVRDRRYFAAELTAKCAEAGVETMWTRHVRRGWKEDFQPGERGAKEVLLLGRKS